MTAFMVFAAPLPHYNSKLEMVQSPFILPIAFVSKREDAEKFVVSSQATTPHPAFGGEECCWNACQIEVL